MPEQYDVRFSILEDASRTAAAQQGVAGGISAGQEKAEKTREVRDRQTSLARLLGLQFTLAALLKNSQIFTGTIGGIFQILGGLIDVTLAPFMPLIVALMTKLAGIIPRWSAYTQAVMPAVIEKITNVGQGIAQIVSGVNQFARKPFNLFDKDGMSADGRLSLSDIFRGLGTAVLGAGVFNALRTGSTGIVSTAVRSLMSGTIGSLSKFLRFGGWVALIFESVNIMNIFKTSGIRAALIRVADTILMTFFSTLGGLVTGAAASFIGLGPLGFLAGAGITGAAYSKYASPKFTGMMGGGGGGERPRSELYTEYMENRTYPTSESASFIGSQNITAFDYDRELPRIGSR
jgi:hypothetical protein